jgi:hypothetical protein
MGGTTSPNKNSRFLPAPNVVRGDDDDDDDGGGGGDDDVCRGWINTKDDNASDEEIGGKCIGSDNADNVFRFVVVVVVFLVVDPFLLVVTGLEFFLVTTAVGVVVVVVVSNTTMGGGCVGLLEDSR